MPSKTRCKFLALVPLLNTSVHDGSSWLTSSAMFWRISLSWVSTKTSFSGLSRRRAMVARALSCWPCFASHLGVSGMKRQRMTTIAANKHWHATGNRHCIELFAWSVAKQSQDARATPMMMSADWTTSSAPLFSAGSVSDCRIGTATVLRPTPTPAICNMLTADSGASHGIENSRYARRTSASSCKMQLEWQRPQWQ